MLEYFPVYKPYVTDQHETTTYSQYEVPSCVANTLATIIEILHYRKTRVSDRKSIIWIYGNRATNDYRDEGMYTSQALARLMVDGVPSFEDLPSDSPLRGNRFYTNYRWEWDGSQYVYRYLGDDYVNAETIVAQYKPYYAAVARKHKITGYTRLYTTADIQAAILRYGAVFMEIDNGDDMWNTGDDGILVDTDGWVDPMWHSLPIIGWKQINGKLYWIGQNSWGPYWGDGDYPGFVYIPYDSKHIYPQNSNRSWWRVEDSTAPAKIRPDDWQWSSFEIDLFTSRGDTMDFRAKRWNAFIDRVKAFLTYKDCIDNFVTPQTQEAYNLIQTGSNCTYEVLLNMAKMPEIWPDYSEFPATKFNTVRFAIGSMVSTGIPTYYKGDQVKGADFLTLASKLNSIY